MFNTILKSQHIININEIFIELLSQLKINEIILVFSICQVFEILCAFYSIAHTNSDQAHFKYSVVTYDQWLPNWTAQPQNIFLFCPTSVSSTRSLLGGLRSCDLYIYYSTIDWKMKRFREKNKLFLVIFCLYNVMIKNEYF